MKHGLPARHRDVLIYLKDRKRIFSGVLMDAVRAPGVEWWAMYAEGALPVPDQTEVSHWQLMPEPPETN